MIDMQSYAAMLLCVLEAAAFSGTILLAHLLLRRMTSVRARFVRVFGCLCGYSAAVFFVYAIGLYSDSNYTIAGAIYYSCLMSLIRIPPLVIVLAGQALAIRRDALT